MNTTNENPSEKSTGTSPLLVKQREYFAEALAVVRSGPATLADEITQTRAPTGRVVGAPRYFTNEALLTSALYTACFDEVLTISKIHEATNLLPDDCLAELKLRRNPLTGEAVTLSQVDHAWNRLAEECNASEFRDGRRLPLDEKGKPVDAHREQVIDRKYLRPDLTEEEVRPKSKRQTASRGLPRVLSAEDAATREAHLVALCDALLQATLPSGLVYKTLMMDWTDHETAARHRNGRNTCADPDAEYGRRRPKNKGLRFVKRKQSDKQTHGADAGAGGEGASDAPELDERGFEAGKKEPFFGYNAHFAVGVAEVNGQALPELAVAMRVTAADDMGAVAPIAVAMLDSARAAGHPIHTLGVDRGYSMRRPATLHVPVAERGVFLVYDFTKKDYGRQGTHKGAVLVNGVPHCPFTPRIPFSAQGDDDPLMLPGPQATREDWREYWRLRDQQDRFQFRALGKRTPDLKQRYQCPALAGRVRCPFCPSSLSLPHGANTPDIETLMPEGQQPLACCSKTFTADIELGLGRRQEPVHGTREWVRSYDRRSATERFNSAIKQLGIARMDVRVLGRAKRSLMLAVAAAATNLQIRRAWATEHAEPDAAAA